MQPLGLVAVQGNGRAGPTALWFGHPTVPKRGYTEWLDYYGSRDNCDAANSQFARWSRKACTKSLRRFW